MPDITPIDLKAVISVRNRRHQSPEKGDRYRGRLAKNRLDRNPQIDLAELEALHNQSFGWAMSQCGFDRGQAEEVLQNSYAAIVSGRARFGGRSSLKTWLFGVIKRQARAERRRVATGLRVLERYFHGVVPGENPGPEAAPADSGPSLFAALVRLSARQRDVIELVFYRDLTLEEAAQVMGISVGSARQHYARAKKRLAELADSGERG